MRSDRIIYVTIRAVQEKRTLREAALRSAEVQKDDNVGVAMLVGKTDSYVFLVNPKGKRLSLSSVSEWD